MADSGTVRATGLHAVLDPVAAAGSPEPRMVAGCTVLSANRAICPMLGARVGGLSLARYDSVGVNGWDGFAGGVFELGRG